jgi:tryptophan halogenase
MSESRADAFRASLAQGEIRLQFGANAADQVALARDIALPPATAQRLLSRLREALRESERRAVAVPAEVVARMGTTLLNAPPQDAGALAARVFESVDALGVPYRHERSLRLAPGRLQANRVLVSLDRARLGEGAAPRIAQICAQLGMPPGPLAQVEARVAESRGVHFGFESDGERGLYKAYFERLAAGAEAAAGAPTLLHLAYKWDPAAPQRCVTTRYVWHPGLAAAALRERMAGIYGPGAPLEAALALLGLAAARVDAARLQFLEVEEDGNARRSFDLNVYDAGLAVRDFQAPLARLREHFGVRPGQFQALYDQIRNRPLGHLAGGVHRDGEAFATVYYGVERRG